MFRTLRHIARPVLMLLLGLYTSSLVLCVECFVAGDADCTALVNQLINTPTANDYHDEVSRDSQATTSQATASQALLHAEHDHSIHPCLSQIPVFFETASFGVVACKVHYYFPANTLSSPSLAAQTPYRPPIA